MLLMIDNYDSFTFNIVQYFSQLGETVEVRRNDKITLAEIEALNPDRLVISPGPCSPEEAGVSVEAIRSSPVKWSRLGGAVVPELARVTTRSISPMETQRKRRSSS